MVLTTRCRLWWKMIHIDERKEAMNKPFTRGWNLYVIVKMVIMAHAEIAASKIF